MKATDSFPAVQTLAAKACFFFLVLAAKVCRASTETGPIRADSDSLSGQGDEIAAYRVRGDVLGEAAPKQVVEPRCTAEARSGDNGVKRSKQRSSKLALVQWGSSLKRLSGRTSGAKAKFLAGATLVAAGAFMLLPVKNSPSTPRGIDDLHWKAILPGGVFSIKLIVGFIVLLVIFAAFAAPTTFDAVQAHQAALQSLVKKNPPPVTRPTKDTDPVIIGEGWKAEDGTPKQGQNPFELYFNGRKFKLIFSRYTEAALSQIPEQEEGSLKSVTTALKAAPDGLLSPDGKKVIWIRGNLTRRTTEVVYTTNKVKGVVRSGVEYQFWIPPRAASALRSNPNAMEDFKAVLDALVDEGSSLLDRVGPTPGYEGEEWYIPRAKPTDEQMRVLKLYHNHWDKCQPPVLRQKDKEQGTELYVIGRKWHESTLEREYRELFGFKTSYKDGQAGIKFLFGGTTKFEIFVPRDLENVLRGRGLLDEFLQSLSQPPILPSETKNWTWLEYMFPTRPDVIHWGPQLEKKPADYWTWRADDYNFHVYLPRNVVAAAKETKLENDLYAVI
ncbi:hypothetical protein CSUI_006398 [Cystoisospora suis]|uniref:Transmembrane protein n=1 Tax=Cystoisospora suis TaxID=483139 RepID=A0A2C6KRW1_9APIC|nr:hypothetical protein CSUI_006398 [Cystoisospora suis]